MSQSSEFCCHNPLCCFSTSCCCYCLFRYGLSPETFGTPSYIHVCSFRMVPTSIAYMQFASLEAGTESLEIIYMASDHKYHEKTSGRKYKFCKSLLCIFAFLSDLHLLQTQNTLFDSFVLHISCRTLVAGMNTRIRNVKLAQLISRKLSEIVSLFINISNHISDKSCKPS
jgi:hypothetical protein